MGRKPANLPPAIAQLLESDDPAVRYRARVDALGQRPSPALKRLQQQIPASPRVRQLLSERDRGGRIPRRPYSKWDGAHWVMVALADIGYPPGDADLIPLREQVLDWLFSPEHEQKIRSIDGRVRRCASQEGNALYALLRLGLADDRTDELAERLMRWQWPDGGWNCDKNAAATHSSFMETLIPLRALALHARVRRCSRARRAAAAAAEVFLKRRLFRAQRDGRIICEDFIRLHWPCYWHYDILFGLKVLAEAGLLDDRCAEALELLRAKRLADGGFPAAACYYNARANALTARSLAHWGGVSQRRMNPWVTIDALRVLRAAGRIKPVGSAVASVR